MGREVEPSQGNETEGGIGEESEKAGKEVESCVYNSVPYVAAGDYAPGRRVRFGGPRGIL